MPEPGQDGGVEPTVFASWPTAFDGPTLERPDDREDYGERRVVAIGLAQGFS